jgi:hypothetical protein
LHKSVCLFAKLQQSQINETIIQNSNLGGAILLPFLKRKDGASIGGILVKNRTPDEHSEDKDDPKAGKKAAAQAIIHAVSSSNIEGLVDALEDFFEIADSEPHEEGPHPEPHSYDASKEE